MTVAKSHVSKKNRILLAGLLSLEKFDAQLCDAALAFVEQRTNGGEFIS